MDRLPKEIVVKMKAYPGWAAQKAEWDELKIDENSEYAPIDTKYLKIWNRDIGAF